MIDSGLKDAYGVEIVRAFSRLDIELLRLERPELFERYCTRKEIKITTFENKISKKNLETFREAYPELYNDPDYRKELTARLKGL